MSAYFMWGTISVVVIVAVCAAFQQGWVHGRQELREELKRRYPLFNFIEDEPRRAE